jgi:hypothetical protein
MDHALTGHKKNIIAVKIALITSIVCGIICIGMIARYKTIKKKSFEQAKQKAISINKQAVPRIEEYLTQLKDAVDKIAQDITSGKLSHEKLLTRLAEKPSAIHAIGVAFAPQAFSQDVSLYAPYIFSQGKENKSEQLEKVYDYTAESSERNPLKREKGFSNPFLDPITKTMVIEYHAPFFDAQKNQRGIVFGNYSLENMQHLMASLYSGQLGHGSLCTKEGIFISDPMSELVEQQKSVPQVGREYASVWLGNELEKAIRGEQFFIEQTPDWLSARISWIIFEQIPSTQWYTYGVFAVDQLIDNHLEINRALIDAMLCTILFIILSLSTLCLWYCRVSIKGFWLISWICALGFIASIIFLWDNTYQQIPFSPTARIVEKSSFDINRTIESMQRSPAGNMPLNGVQQKKPLSIPTGIYIHQASVAVDTITLNAYVWQKISLNSPWKIVPGVIFPQATKIDTQEIIRIKDQDIETIGWSIRATLQQQFDYSNYPFDFKKIKITLWPNTFDGSQILVPDLNGYAIMRPPTLPGLSGQINQQSSWLFHVSYFAYQKSNIHVNFGYTQPTQDVHNRPELPELSLHVVANQYALSTLIVNLTPILIILCLLFILLMMAPLMEFPSVFGIISSLFFSGLIAYTAFKAYLPIQQIVFFDYLYFTLQITTLIIAILVVAYYSRFNIPIIKYKHMLIPQLLFWPSVSMAIVVTSLVFFY